MKIKYLLITFLLIIITCTGCKEKSKILAKHETFVNEYYNNHKNDYVWNINNFELSAKYTIVNKVTKEKTLIDKKLNGIINLNNNEFKGSSNNFTLETNTTVLKNDKINKTVITETLNSNGYYKDININNNCEKYYSPYKHSVSIDFNITNNIFNVNNLILDEGWTNKKHEGNVVGYNLQENNVYVLEEIDLVKIQTVFTFDKNYNISNIYGNITSSTDKKEIFILFYLNIKEYQNKDITESYTNELDNYISNLDFLKRV